MTDLESFPIYVGLGANIGSDKEISDRFDRAIQIMNTFPFVVSVQVSSRYQTGAIGVVQSDFINAVACLLVKQPPSASGFLQLLLNIETKLGRDRTDQNFINKEPRTMDLDLLLFGEQQGVFVGPPLCIVPHERLYQRAFALMPLGELFGYDNVLMNTGLTINEHLATPDVAKQNIIQL